MSTNTRIDKATKQVSSNPLLMSVFVGIALIIGVNIGQNGSSGPVVSQAAPADYTTGTPAIEPSETPRNHETSDSLVVSDNSGTVNVGGTHVYEAESPPKRTPATVMRPMRVVEVPVIVERMVERERPPEPKPKQKIWTRPGIPADSRLGRTMLTLKRFEDAGVRIYAEH